MLLRALSNQNIRYKNAERHVPSAKSDNIFYNMHCFKIYKHNAYLIATS